MTDTPPTASGPEEQMDSWLRMMLEAHKNAVLQAESLYFGDNIVKSGHTKDFMTVDKYFESVSIQTA